LHPFGTITFKGKGSPTRVFALLEEGTLLRNVVGSAHAVTGVRKEKRPAPAETVTLRYADKAIACPERKTLSIGRGVPHFDRSSNHGYCRFLYIRNIILFFLDFGIFHGIS
jgi:hypothetical protein